MSTSTYETSPRRRALKRVNSRKRRIERALADSSIKPGARRALTRELNSLTREHKAIHSGRVNFDEPVSGGMTAAPTARPLQGEEHSPRRQSLKRITARLRRIQRHLDSGTLTPQRAAEYRAEHAALTAEHAQIRGTVTATVDFDAFDASQFIPDGFKPNMDYDTLISALYNDCYPAVEYAENFANSYLPRLCAASSALADLLIKNVSHDDKVAIRIVASGEPDAIEREIEQRVSNPVYVDAIRLLDELRAQVVSHRTFADVMEIIAVNGGCGYESWRKVALGVVDLGDLLAMIRVNLGEYRAVTAFLASSLSSIHEEISRANGTYIEYTGDTLADLVTVGSFPSGSVEWLRSRQNGIGGSDVGAIKKVDREYAKENYDEVFWSKVNEITEADSQDESFSRSGMNTPIGRGNAWEEEVLRRFQINNPNLRVAHCKTSWKHNERSIQFANFDGLLIDENDTPYGIVEIKTSSDPSMWGDPSTGIDGIPLQYRAQVLWYMHAADLSEGVLVVMLYDREYREYHFSLTDELVAEMEDNWGYAERFWANVESARQNPDPLMPRKRDYGFSRTAIQRQRNLEPTFRHLAAYTDQDQRVVKDTFYARAGDEASDFEVASHILTQMYAEFDPTTRSKPLIGVDIEATGFSPYYGHIIETGVTVRDHRNQEVRKIKRLHGIPRRAQIGSGTGAEDVHGISVEDIDGKDRFHDPRFQATLLDVFKSGILLAHNASYEDRWFRVHLKGYAEARDRGDITIIDSMNVSRTLVKGTPNHTLKSFVEFNGMEYVNAHRAYNDAVMMTDAFDIFCRNLHNDFLMAE